MVYDITHEKSFQKIPTWLKDVDKFATDCKIRMLIGNKADKKDDRMVPKDRAKAFAKVNNINEFLETSAKVGRIYCIFLLKYQKNCVQGVC